MPRETIRYDADTIWIRYGYGATRYDTLARDNNGSPPPDRVREPIKFMFFWSFQNHHFRALPTAYGGF